MNQLCLENLRSNAASKIVQFRPCHASICISHGTALVRYLGWFKTRSQPCTEILITYNFRNAHYERPTGKPQESSYKRMPSRSEQHACGDHPDTHGNVGRRGCSGTPPPGLSLTCAWCPSWTWPTTSPPPRPATPQLPTGHACTSPGHLPLNVKCHEPIIHWGPASSAALHLKRQLSPRASVDATEVDYVQVQRHLLQYSFHLHSGLTPVRHVHLSCTGLLSYRS